MVTQSIASDGDLSLTNNLDPDRIWFELPEGPVYDIHLFGLPLLVVPGYLMAGFAGIRIELASLAGLFPFICFLTLNKILTDKYWALCLSLYFGISFPLVVVSSKFFPDLIIGLFVFFCFERLLTFWKSGAFGWKNTLFFTIVAGSIPLLHVKGLAPSLLLILFASVLLYCQEIHNFVLKLMVLWSNFIISLSVVAVYHYVAYGNVFGIKGVEQLHNSIREILLVLSGLHWDRLHGIFIQNPFLMIGLIGLPLFYVKKPYLCIGWLTLYASLIIPHTLHWNYYGGGLFGRFQWSSFALWVFPLGFAANWFRQKYRLSFILFIGLGFLYQIGLIMQSTNHKDLVDGKHLSIFSHFRTLLPSFTEPTEFMYHPQNYVVWLLTVSLIIFGCFLDTSER